MDNEGSLVIFVGPDKCGTTYIYSYLARRKDVAINPAKETWYFDRRYKSMSKSEYLASFPELPAKTPKVEVSHNYLSSPFALSRILKDFPNAIVVVGERDRVARTKSQFKHFVKMGLTKETFDVAISVFPVLIYNSLIGIHLSAIPSEFRDRIYFFDFSQLVTNEFEFQDRISDLCGIPRRNISIGPINEAKVSRFPLLMRIGVRIMRALRYGGLGGVGNKIKTAVFRSELLFHSSAEIDIGNLPNDLKNMFDEDERILELNYGVKEVRVSRRRER